MAVGNLSLVWDDLKSGIDDIFKLETLKRSRYMELYTHVYNYCTFVEHRGSTQGRMGMDPNPGGGKLVGLELYKKLRDYLRAHVHNVKVKGDKLTGEEMLSYFEKSWSEFRFAATVLNGACAYLNRHWVKRECDEGRKNVYAIYALALITWREHLLKPHARVLIGAILREVDRERRGEVLLTCRLRKIIECLVELGVTSEQYPRSPSNSANEPSNDHFPTISNPTGAQPRLSSDAASVGPAGGYNPDWAASTPFPCLPDGSGQQQQCPRTSSAPFNSSDGSATCSNPLAVDGHSNLSVYQDYFERSLLCETERFYRLESAQFLQNNSVPEYLQKVELRLKEECDRVQAYLHISTLPKLTRSCEHYLIGEHIDRLTSEFVNLLNDDREEDIWRMYKLLRHFPSGIRVLVEMVENHVEERGLEALRQVAQAALTDPRLYIDTILQIHRKNYNLVVSAFATDPAFARALDKGCERFINKNAVTELAGSTRKSPELLAKYADFLLKKGPKNIQLDDLEEPLGQVMTVFKYIDDKDVFQKFYSKTLARRLVHNLSVSEDAEASMISKLKEACGFEYTAKLQRMFQDVNAMRDLNAKFKEYLETSDTAPVGVKKGIDFNVMILSSNAWPYQAQTTFSIPQELEQCQSAFLSFYHEHHNGRKLSWCFQLSRGELITNYTKTVYTFQVSTYQMSILMLYNSALVLSVSDIQSQTGIEPNLLTQILHILLKAKVLKLDTSSARSTDMSLPESASTSAAAAPASAGLEDSTDTGNLTPETRLSLYTDYKNKRVRVYLNVPLKSEVKQETEQTLGNVESDRKLIVQACIVRIMKSRKVMKHQQLINEVISQLSARFKPTILLIKRCIAALIEREYIQRDGNERDAYEYLA
ncbi:unnamed protein product [Calicophoron daubneyi]|uniref:Cullin family profile domain-containing protein n=1 Tax=Calicophoron daubneyi TaxID=300641 RepID=A0AAV2T297_CALDB